MLQSPGKWYSQGCPQSWSDAFGERQGLPVVGRGSWALEGCRWPLWGAWSHFPLSCWDIEEQGAAPGPCGRDWSFCLFHPLQTLIPEINSPKFLKQSLSSKLQATGFALSLPSPGETPKGLSGFPKYPATPGLDPGCQESSRCSG